MKLTRNIVRTRTEDGTVYWNGNGWSHELSDAFLFFGADEAEVEIEQNRIRLDGERGPFVVRAVTVTWKIEPNILDQPPVLVPNDRADQEFVAVTFSRRSIAGEINTMLGLDDDNSMGRENHDPNMTPVAEDDERLTDEICSDFAKQAGSILEDAAADGWSESRYFEAWAEFVQDFAEERLGLTFEP